MPEHSEISRMKPWQTLSRTPLLDRQPWFSVSSEHVRLPNGYEIAEFYRIDMPDWAQVFAITEDGHVAMVEQFKQGAQRVSLELPAGYVEPGEDPAVCARRELREETGLEADSLDYLGRYFIDGNRGCGASHIFLARNARQIDEPHLEASEVIIQHRLTLDDVRNLWLGGKLENIGTLAAVGLVMGHLESGQ